MEKKKTYCNPMALPDIPRGIDGLLLAGNASMGDDYWSISDPDGFYYDGKWCMFTSYGGVYTSKDLLNWERHYFEGVDKGYYSPMLAERDGKFYYIGHSSPVFVADSMFGPYTKLGYFKDLSGKELKLMDPNLFKDDDGEIYLNWADEVEPGIFGILAVRLDRNDFTQFATEPKVLVKFDGQYEWERWGEYNQDKTMGWCEGSWMIKVGKRYYLGYSGSGTTFSTYATGVCYSDSPLGDYTRQKNNPVVSKKTGLLRGGGHSGFIKKSDDEIWAFYTCIGGYHNMFERLIGMDRVFVKDGELYCEPSDTPHTIDGKACEDMIPLTFRSRTNASSNAPGRDAIYAFDDSMQTFWQPAENDREPELEVSLRGNYTAKAFRLIRQLVGLDYENGITPQPLSYKFMLKNIDGEWVTVYDATDSKEVMMVDYIEFEPMVATDAKIVFKNPEGKAKEAIRSFTVFGEKFIG